MTILLVSPYLPHPLSGNGASVYLYRLLERLSARHEVTLLSFCDNEEYHRSKDLDKLPIFIYLVHRDKGFQNNFFKNLLLFLARSVQFAKSVILWQPYYVSKWHSRRMSRLVKKVTQEKQFDVVQFEFTFMGQYIKRVNSGKTFLHEIDVSYRPAYRKFKKTRSLLQKVAAYIEWCRWAQYEPNIVQKFDHVFTVTENDRLLLQWLTKRKNISYFPHAFEATGILPEYKTREPHSILLVGNYDHYPNLDAALWLCREIFPQVRSKYSDALLYVIGPHPPNELRAFSQKETGIQVLGFVDDVDECLRRYSVFAAPLRMGGGIKNKILYAMAQGIPVVTTKVGSEGIEGINNSNVLIGNTTQQIVEHICTLFENPSKGADVGKGGWELVRRYYSWDAILSKLESDYQIVLRK